MNTEAEILYEAMDSGQWTITRNLPVPYLTDEANEEFKWSIRRAVAPFCGKDGIRQWEGPTPSVALARAQTSLRKKS